MVFVTTTSPSPGVADRIALLRDGIIVETGPSRVLDPQHPYAHGLLDNTEMTS